MAHEGVERQISQNNFSCGDMAAYRLRKLNTRTALADGSKMASCSPHQLAEAYAFSKLAEHLRMRTDVQNIDVMILAGFCRNCLSKWCRPSSGSGTPPATHPLLSSFASAGTTRARCTTAST